MLTTLLAVALRLAPEELAIAWEAPVSCPDAAYLRERVAEQLRGVEVEATGVRAHVSAPAAPGAPWRLSIAIGDEGQRELEAESCAALADAAAVMVAISLNASVPAEDGDVPEPPVVEAPAVPTAEPVAIGDVARVQVQPQADDAPDPVERASTPEPSAEPRRRRLAAVLGVTAGAHGVGLPRSGAQLGGRVGVRWGPLVAALVGMHSFRRERPVVDDIAASYQLTTGGLELCGVLPLGRGRVALEGFACGEAEAGGLRAEGLRAVSPQVQRHPWVGAGGGVGAAWAARPWLALGLRADVVAPLLGRSFVIGDASAGEVGPVDVRGALVLELRVPEIVPGR